MSRQSDPVGIYSPIHTTNFPLELEKAGMAVWGSNGKIGAEEITGAHSRIKSFRKL